GSSRRGRPVGLFRLPFVTPKRCAHSSDPSRIFCARVNSSPAPGVSLLVHHDAVGGASIKARSECGNHLPNRNFGRAPMEECHMRTFFGTSFAVVLGLSLGLARAEEKPVTSGPSDKAAGPFQVKAITGEKAGTQLCYYCQYNAEVRPAVVMIFTQKAD